MQDVCVFKWWKQNSSPKDGEASFRKGLLKPGCGFITQYHSRSIIKTHIRGCEVSYWNSKVSWKKCIDFVFQYRSWRVLAITSTQSAGASKATSVQFGHPCFWHVWILTIADDCLSFSADSLLLRLNYLWSHQSITLPYQACKGLCSNVHDSWVNQLLNI